MTMTGNIYISEVLSFFRKSSFPTPAAVVHPVPLKPLEVGPFKLRGGLSNLKLNTAQKIR